MTEPEISEAELRRLRNRALAGMSPEEAVIQQITELTIGQQHYVFKPETRCRVCRDESLAKTVNRLLSLGETYQSIVNQIDVLQERYEPHDRVTYSSLYNHAKRHFPIEETARAHMREIIERRAVERQVDFVEGFASAMTPLAYLEILMNRGAETMALQEPGAVSPELGMKAAEKLHALTAGDDNERDRRREAEMAQIIEAVRSVVPMNMWSQIVAKLDANSALPPGGTIDAETIEEP